MTAAAATVLRDYVSGACPPGYEMTRVVKANVTVFQGMAMCMESATVGLIALAASLTAPEFAGFALEAVEANAAGARVKLLQKGVLRLATIAEVAGLADDTSSGLTIYMSDSGTGFTLDGTNNVSIGKLIGVVGGEVFIDFEAFPLRSV